MTQKENKTEADGYMDDLEGEKSFDSILADLDQLLADEDK